MATTTMVIIQVSSDGFAGFVFMMSFMVLLAIIVSFLIGRYAN